MTTQDALRPFGAHRSFATRIRQLWRFLKTDTLGDQPWFDPLHRHPNYFAFIRWFSAAENPCTGVQMFVRHAQELYPNGAVLRLEVWGPNCEQADRHA